MEATGLENGMETPNHQVQPSCTVSTVFATLNIANQYNCLNLTLLPNRLYGIYPGWTISGLADGCERFVLLTLPLCVCANQFSADLLALSSHY